MDNLQKSSDNIVKNHITEDWEIIDECIETLEAFSVKYSFTVDPGCKN